MGRRLFALIICCLWFNAANAHSPQQARMGWLTPWTCPKFGCCPDDYCPKPCPIINPFSRCGGPDDYCLKP